MRYRVILSPNAEADIVEAEDYIARDSVTHALRWRDGLYEAITSLNEMPSRCAYARENETFQMEVRQLVYKSHRVIFSVRGDEVHVHRVVHTARENLDSPDELF